MKAVARVLFHKTPCCQAQFFIEYPPDMKIDEIWEGPFTCLGCSTKYRIELSDFKWGNARRLRWYPAQTLNMAESSKG